MRENTWGIPCLKLHSEYLSENQIFIVIPVKLQFGVGALSKAGRLNWCNCSVALSYRESWTWGRGRGTAQWAPRTAASQHTGSRTHSLSGEITRKVINTHFFQFFYILYLTLFFHFCFQVNFSDPYPLSSDITYTIFISLRKCKSDFYITLDIIFLGILCPVLLSGLLLTLM